jgi:hypothetical protein
MLAVSGSLNRKCSGLRCVRRLRRKRSIPPADHWPKNADGPETWRRSIYVFAKRSIRLPMLETFDAPD